MSRIKLCNSCGRKIEGRFRQITLAMGAHLDEEAIVFESGDTYVEVLKELCYDCQKSYVEELHNAIQTAFKLIKLRYTTDKETLDKNILLTAQEEPKNIYDNNGPCIFKLLKRFTGLWSN